MIILLIIAFFSFYLDATAGSFMVVAVFLAMAGSYYSMLGRRETAATVLLGYEISKTILGTQGVALAVFAIALLVVVLRLIELI